MDTGYVAVGIARIPNSGPPVSEDVPIQLTLGDSKYEVRFDVMPRVGQRVRWGLYTWVVADVTFHAARDPDEENVLVAGPARVRLELAQQGGQEVSGSGAVLARVFRREFLGDESYPGEVMAFDELPRVGEYLTDCWRERNVRYVVREVNHVVSERADVKPEVVVEQDPNSARSAPSAADPSDG